VVTPDKELTRVTALSAEELWPMVKVMREAIANPISDPRAPAQALYDRVVAPIAEDLRVAGATSVLWSLDGVLRYVPVAALFDGERWLAERYASAVMTVQGGRRSTSAGDLRRGRHRIP
jgi:CHAT domain-containing protein